ncbi:MAG: hypothetical protein U9M90_00305 [Patescibacteria group bacterium]|nr:hypothetical protein [Patescibacteria group bacterium]
MIDTTFEDRLAQEKCNVLQEKYSVESVEKDELEQANHNLRKTLSEEVISNFEAMEKLRKERSVTREKKEKAETALSELKKQVHSLID